MSEGFCDGAWLEEVKSLGRCPWREYWSHSTFPYLHLFFRALTKDLFITLYSSRHNALLLVRLLLERSCFWNSHTLRFWGLGINHKDVVIYVTVIYLIIKQVSTNELVGSTELALIAGKWKVRITVFFLEILHFVRMISWISWLRLSQWSTIVFLALTTDIYFLHFWCLRFWCLRTWFSWVSSEASLVVYRWLFPHSHTLSSPAVPFCVQFFLLTSPIA